MALPAVYVKFTMVCSSPQKNNFYNVFYYRPDDTPSFTDDTMQDSSVVGGALFSVLSPGLPALMTLSSSIIGWNCELHRNGQSYDTASNANIGGTTSSDELADFEAVVIQKRTEVSGKSGRGRWFVGPIAEILTDENYLTITGKGYADIVAGAWKQEITVLDVTWQPMLYSKKTASLTEISMTFANPKIGSIGGRKSHSIL